jgi:alternate signal-mediated exported protein
MTNLKRKAPIIGAIALLFAVVIGGTFAYFSQESAVDNYLTARAYDSTLEENFTPPEDGNFTPGVEVDKEVYVTNSGDVGMLVRITYEEYWNSALNGSLVLADPVAGYYNGDTDASSIVKKATTSTLWTYGGDGWYYYLAELIPGASTQNFIDSIMLKESTMDTTTTYDVRYWDGTTEVTTLGLDLAAKDALVASITTPSYLISVVSNQNTSSPTGDYQLTIKAQTVQAISEAALDWASLVTDVDVLFFLNGIS